MQYFSRYLGAGVSALGALLVLVDALLSTFGSGDHEPILRPNTPVLLPLIVVPALLVLGSSIIASFRTLPRWLIVLCWAIIIPIFLLHLLVSAFSASFGCFDVPGCEVHMGTGFWLPLIGFPLSMVGLAVIAAAQQRHPLPGPPAASP